MTSSHSSWDDALVDDDDGDLDPDDGPWPGDAWLDDAWGDEDGTEEEDFDGSVPFATGAVPPPGGRLDTDEDVLQLFLRLIGPERDGPRTLWVLLLDSDNRSLPAVVPIGDLPTMVDREFVTNLAGIMSAAGRENAPGGSIAFALVRRGGGDRGTYEAGWSQALREAMTQVGLPVRAIVAIGRDRSRVLPGGRFA